MTVQTSDIIKAVGFLTIYWGYLELEIDALIRFAAPICPLPRNSTIDKFLQRPFKIWVEYLKQCLLDRCDAVRPYPELARERRRIDTTLIACLDAADVRNSIMHSAIYSLSDRGTVKRERKSGHVEVVRAKEICNLADGIYKLGGRVSALHFVANRLREAPLS
jgi:hypothetical protein